MEAVAAPPPELLGCSACGMQVFKSVVDSDDIWSGQAFINTLNVTGMVAVAAPPPELLGCSACNTQVSLGVLNIDAVSLARSGLD